jgi:serine/threonine protein kinase
MIDALAYLHKHKVIHRDIKPENILIDDEVTDVLTQDMLKICDFGWSTRAPNNKRNTLCGTMDYLPPEMVERRDHDETADLWCLGVLAYELSEGRPPFESKKSTETYRKIREVDIRFPAQFSTELRDFVQKLLVKEGDKRMTLLQAKEHPWIVKNSKAQ